MPVRVPRALLVLALGLTVGLVAVLVSSRPPAASGLRAPAEPAASSGPSDASGGERDGALAVLHDWDERRSEAWAAADAARLADLYVDGSAAGRADVALLQRYRDRGVRVPDVRMQVLGAAVLVDRPRRVVVRVTERLASREARVGTRLVLLPRDAAQVHVVDLRREHGTWRVASVSR